MLSKENYKKVKLLRQRIDNRIQSIKELQGEIDTLERVKKERIALLKIDIAQIDEIAREEIPEDV